MLFQYPPVEEESGPWAGVKEAGEEGDEFSSDGAMAIVVSGSEEMGTSSKANQLRVPSTYP